MNTFRKGAALILAALVLFFTTATIGDIWGWWEIEDIFNKSLKTLLVIFLSSAILLFVFAVIYKSDDGKGPANPAS